MNAVSIPVIVIAGITLYAGFNQFLIFLRRRQRREDLTFALTCLAAGIYDIFSAHLYSASSLAEGFYFQRMQVITLALLSVAFLWFIADYTGLVSKRILLGLSAYFLFAALCGVIDRSGLVWHTDQPSIKIISWGSLGEIIYYEATPGLLTNIQSVMGLVGLGYIFWCAIRLQQSGQEKRARPLLIAMAFFIVGVMNDIAVSSGMYQSIYLIEYSYLGMILLMASSLSEEIVDAALLKDELQKSEERFRLLAENAKDLIYRYQFLPSPGFDYVSPSATALTGYTPEEHYANPELGFQMIHPEDRHILENMSNSPTSSAPIVLRWIRKDGTTIFTEQRNTIIYDSRGIPIALEGVARDITERKKAESKVQESAEKIRAVFESITDGITVTDLQGTVLDINEAILKIHNIHHRDEIIGKNIFEFIAKEDLARAMENMKATLNSGFNSVVEYRLVKHDGSEFDGELSAVLLKDMDHNPIGYVVTTRDISERKRQEREKETIIAVANAMRSAPSLTQLLHIILDQIDDLFHTNGSAIFLFKSTTDEMVVELGTGKWASINGLRIPGASSLSRRVMSNKKVIQTEEAKELEIPWLESLEGPTSVIISPLIIQENTIGAMWVTGGDEFSQEEIHLLGLIGNMAASAIHRASLHEQTERRLSYLSGLRTIDLAIVGSST